VELGALSDYESPSHKTPLIAAVLVRMLFNLNAQP
jgi:hypothetical protein